MHTASSTARRMAAAAAELGASGIFGRRELLRCVLTAAAATALGTARAAGHAVSPPAGGAARSDFDFFLGRWRVAHRRLKKRLAGNDDWEEFNGTSHCLALLGGIVNVNESLVNRGGGSYYGMGLRAFDASSNTWADWYLDGRKPTHIDVPGTGRFAQGVGTFVSEETFEGRPVVVRGLWRDITARSFTWEQAFSPDAGQSWETNWVMRHTRID
jgi:hypothetical protein